MGVPLCRRQAEPGQRWEEGATMAGAAALLGCATPKAVAPLHLPHKSLAGSGVSA